MKIRHVNSKFQSNSLNRGSFNVFFFSIASVNEYFFAGKGAAVVLESNDELDTNVLKNFSEDSQYLKSFARSDIQRHLQSMFYLLREEETLKMVSRRQSSMFARNFNKLLKITSRLLNWKLLVLVAHGILWLCHVWGNFLDNINNKIPESITPKIMRRRHFIQMFS